VAVPVAVLGAGAMGSNHARVLSQMPWARLSAVADSDAVRAERVAAQFGCGSARDLASLPEPVQAVVVATPTETHRDLAVEALEMGLHVLVEKPLTATIAEGEELVAAAERAGRILATGHVERFNPACLDLPRFVTDPVFIQTRRLSPFSERVKEGVVRDMMIHDIDLVLWLARSEPVRVNAYVVSPRSATEDLATATVVFASGLVAQFTATRVGQDKVRQIDVVLNESVVNVDLLRQDITIRRQATAEYPEEGARRLKESSVIEIPYLEHRGEPLFLELRDFVTAVESNGTPLVDGRAGLAALRLCDRILDAAEGD